MLENSSRESDSCNFSVMSILLNRIERGKRAGKKNLGIFRESLKGTNAVNSPVPRLQRRQPVAFASIPEENVCQLDECGIFGSCPDQEFKKNGAHPLKILSMIDTNRFFNFFQEDRPMGMLMANWQDEAKNRNIQFSFKYEINSGTVSITEVVPTRVTFVCPTSNTTLHSVGVYTDSGRKHLASKIHDSVRMNELKSEIATRYATVTA